MFVSPDFKSKEDLKRAIAEGQDVSVFNPFDSVISDGCVNVEGPRAPSPSVWSGTVTLQDDRVTEVK